MRVSYEDEAVVWTCNRALTLLLSAQKENLHKIILSHRSEETHEQLPVHML